MQKILLSAGKNPALPNAPLTANGNISQQSQQQLCSQY
jgi:hypothetical protein